MGNPQPGSLRWQRRQKVGRFLPALFSQGKFSLFLLSFDFFSQFTHLNYAIMQLRTGTKAPTPACQGPPSSSTCVGLPESASPGAAFQSPNPGILNPHSWILTWFTSSIWESNFPSLPFSYPEVKSCCTLGHSVTRHHWVKHCLAWDGCGAHFL